MSSPAPPPALEDDDAKTRRKKKRKNRWGEAKPAPDEAPRPGETAQQARIRAMKESVAARLAAAKALNQQNRAPAKKAKTYDLNLGEPVAKQNNPSNLRQSPTEPLSKPKPPPSNPYLAHKHEEHAEQEDEDSDTFPMRAAKKRQQSKAFHFVKPGQYVAAAEQQRQRDAAAAVFLSGRKQGHTIVTTTTALGSAAESANHHRPDAHPDTKMPLVMEWWDLDLLPAELKKEVIDMESKALVQQSKASLKAVESKGENDSEGMTGSMSNSTPEKDPLDDLRQKCFSAAAISNSKTSSLVQHIVPIRPLSSSDKKEPVLHLTKKELKRQRKLRRQEKQQKLQDLQAAGLIPAPEPRLTLSNFIQVLGDQAYVDPSQIEAKVQAQVQARQKAHLERNAAHRLTKEQRSAKAARKYAAKENDVVVTAIFRVEDASHPYHRAKMDLNAQQLQLTGVLVECGVACVIVEGSSKAIQKFSRLMLVRMKWTGPNDDDDEDDEEADVEASTKQQPFPKENGCTEVWKGAANKRIFKGFYFHSCETHDQARKLLKGKGVEHYWNLTVAKTDGPKLRLTEDHGEESRATGDNEDSIMKDVF